MDKFEKYHSRENESSAKWNLMREKMEKPLEDVVPMSVADMEFELADEIIDGLKEYLDNTILGYTMPWDGYYESVINHYRNHYGVELEKEEIVPVVGVVPALFNAVEAFTEPGEGVIIFTPVYPQFDKAINMTNRAEVRCPLILKDEEYEIDFDLFEEQAKESSNRLVIFCSPHNPSGRIWTAEELEKVVNICKEHNLVLISDEIHSDLGLFGNKVQSIFSLEGVEDMTMVFSSASKTYNLAGLQTANALIKNKDLKAKFMREIEKIGIHGPNMLGLKATELAYRYGDKWLKGALEVIEKNFELTKEFFNRYGDKFTVYNTQATYLAWIGFEAFSKEYDIHSKNFCEFLDETNFFINPGVMFGKESKYYIRINLALPTHKYVENLDRLGSAIKDKFGI